MIYRDRNWCRNWDRGRDRDRSRDRSRDRGRDWAYDWERFGYWDWLRPDVSGWSFVVIDSLLAV